MIPVLSARHWRERALWLPDTGTLVVAELLGTNEYYALSSDPVGIHPMLRQARIKVGDHLPWRTCSSGTAPRCTSTPHPRSRPPTSTAVATWR